MNRLRFGILLLCSSLLLVSAKYYPAFGMVEGYAANGVQNGARHTFHTRGQVGEQLSEGSCKACHLGYRSEKVRAMLVSMNIGCSDCHAEMTAMENAQGIQGVEYLTCKSCHDMEMTTTTACLTCHTAKMEQIFWHFEL